jgi:hypothetical protein
MTKDYPLLEIGIHLAASKNKRYRESVVEYFQVLIEFLEAHGLTRRAVLMPGQRIPSDFTLMRSDLSDEGFDFIKTSLNKWTAMVEAGRPIKDMSILEDELRTLRGKANQ